MDLEQGLSLTETMDSIRDNLFQLALQLGNGRQSEAARLLRISPQAVNNYLRRRDKGGAGGSQPQ